MRREEDRGGWAKMCKSSSHQRLAGVIVKGWSQSEAILERAEDDMEYMNEGKEMVREEGDASEGKR